MIGAITAGYLGGLTVPLVGDFESIATITPYTTTTTVDFTSIPSTYSHLQLRASAANTGGAANMTIRFNGDTGIFYSYHFLEGNGASASSGGAGTSTYIVGPVVTNTASSYTGIVVDILDYSNTNKNKTVRLLAGADLNGSSTWLDFMSGAWFKTNAITSITITLGSGAFTSNSHWALYGVK